MIGRSHLLSILLLACLPLCALHAEEELTYDGKTVSEWTLALKGRDEDVREAATQALVKIGSPAVPALIEALEQKVYAHWRVAHALGRIGPGARKSVPALIVALRGKDRGGRWAAAWALGRIRGDAKATVPALSEALKDENWSVRMSAGNALREFGPGAKAAVPPLTEALRDNNKDVRRAAAYALAEIGPDAKTAVAALAEACKDKGTRVSAHYALFRIASDQKAIPALIEALSDEDMEVRWNSARALGRIGPAAEAAVPALIEASKDKHRDVRYAAADALERIRGEE